MYALGRLYFKGNGVKKDIKAAIKYFTESARFGNQYAKDALNNLRRKEDEAKKREDKPKNKNPKNDKAESSCKKGSGKAPKTSRNEPVRKNNVSQRHISDHAYKYKKNLCALRAAVSVNSAMRQLVRQYDRKIAKEKREYDYELDQKIEQDKERSM